VTLSTSLVLYLDPNPIREVPCSEPPYTGVEIVQISGGGEATVPKLKVKCQAGIDPKHWRPGKDLLLRTRCGWGWTSEVRWVHREGK
jgi:hypothetical protein